MKSRDGKSKTREEKRRRKKITKEKVSEERRSRCAKRYESRETLCFSMICRSGGSKSRLAKPAAAEPAGQMRDEKLHTVVARSTFASEKAKNTLTFRALFEVQMSKKCTALWRKAHFEVKMLADRQIDR